MVLSPPGLSASSEVPVLLIPLVPEGRLDLELDGSVRAALVEVGGSSEAGPPARVSFAASSRILAVLFEVEAEPPLRVVAPAGGPVYGDECVELFVADPGDPAAYREIVVNPAGAPYGAEIRNPDGSRATWTLRAGRLPEGLAVEVAGEPVLASPSAWTRWRCRIEVPWRSLSASGLPPVPGDERRLNAYRIARGRNTRFQALSPTFRSSPPDFHVPARFARGIFTETVSAFKPAC